MRKCLFLLTALGIGFAPCSKSNSPPAAEAATAEPVVLARQAPVPVVIPRGTALQVRINHGVDTRNNRAGDSFSGVLMRPVVVRGGTVLPAGTAFTGHVTTAANSGRLKGRAVIGVTLDSFRLRGREHRIHTRSVTRVSKAHAKRNAFAIGGGSGLGAAIGALAGGGKGAAIGALAGAGAGTAGAAATGKLHVGIASETGLTFRLSVLVAM